MHNAVRAQIRGGRDANRARIDLHAAAVDVASGKHERAGTFLEDRVRTADRSGNRVDIGVIHNDASEVGHDHGMGEINAIVEELQAAAWTRTEQESIGGVAQVLVAGNAQSATGERHVASEAVCGVGKVEPAGIIAGKGDWRDQSGG